MTNRFKNRKPLKLYPLLLAVIALAGMLIFINYFTLKTTSAVRAYINAESHYSKGQKDATRNLIMYINTQDEKYWGHFREAIKIPLGDNEARVKLMNNGSDVAIYRGFLDGKNHLDDIGEMVWLFRNFKEVSFMKHAIQLWEEGDGIILKLNLTALQTHLKISNGTLSDKVKDEMIASLNQLTGDLSIKEKEFSDTLGATARSINAYIFFTNIIMTLLIIGGASAYALKMIGRLKGSQANLKRNYEALIETNHELDKFIYSASHDLRSPITSLKGLIEIAQSETDPKRMQNYLKLMQESLSRQDQFIKDIIYFSKNKRTEVEKQNISVSKIIDEVIEQHKFIKSAGGISFQKEIEQEHMTTDPARLKIILSNIISNAIKYSDQNKSERYISIKTSKERNDHIIHVSDNGIGIKKDDLPRIFDMFFVTQHNNKGTGLGLYITKETIEKLNGSICAESEQGRGTEFTIKIPA